MGQRADGNEVHSGPGNFANRLQCHAAAGLRLGSATNLLHGFAEFVAAHVVEQDDVRAGLGCGLGVIDRVCLDLNFKLGSRLASQRHRSGNVAVERGQVIVLDHHLVV